jgi:hypothetical protein
MSGDRPSAVWGLAACTLLSTLATAGCTLAAPLGGFTGGNEAGVTGPAPGGTASDGGGGAPPGADAARPFVDAASSVVDAGDTTDAGAAPGDDAAPGDEVLQAGDDAAAGDDTGSLGGPIDDAGSGQPPPPGPIGFVQSNSTTAPGTARTLRATYANAQGAGDLNVIAIGWNDATFVVTSVTDSAGNSYALAVGPTRLSPDLTQAIYYAPAIQASGAGANTVTVALDGTADAVDLRIAEYSGLSASPLDVVAAQSGSQSGDVSSGPATTTSDRALLVGAGMTTDIFTSGGGSFVPREITDLGDILEDRVVSVPGAYAADAPVSASSEYVMQLAVFR